MLANVLRTDAHAHRPLPAGSELAQAIAVLARAQQDAVWARTQAHNKLRSHLREYHPGLLAAFAGARGGLTRPEARVILAAAPTPADAAKLTLTQLRSLLKKAGRQRGIDTEATRLRDALRAPQMRQLPLVEHAMGRQALALPGQLNATCTAADDLEQATIESLNQHPDAEIITSFPGLGPLTGARVLAETGDDRSRFQDAKGLKACAGAAPITRASGKTRAVLHRRVKNQRLAATGYVWAFAALTASPGARAHYDRRKTAGDRHAAASATSSGASSAASTTAWPPAPVTTKPLHSPLPLGNSAKQLDNLTASDVWRRSETTATLGHEEGAGSRSADPDTAPEAHLTDREQSQWNSLTQRGFRSERLATLWLSMAGAHRRV